MFLFGEQRIKELTDALPVATIADIDATLVEELLVDVAIDQGCIVDVLRYADKEKSIALTPGTQQIIAPGGGTGSYVYTNPQCAAIDVVVTKTEVAGDTDGFFLGVTCTAA